MPSTSSGSKPSQTELLDGNRALGIRIQPDVDRRVLTISDNGIGMTRDEVIENLGTIAKSGTREFSARVADSAEGNDVEALIGQFGVGFYSAFMAASDITVVSRHATEAGATRWFSTGDGQFEVSDAERDARHHHHTHPSRCRSRECLG